MGILYQLIQKLSYNSLVLSLAFHGILIYRKVFICLKLFSIRSQIAICGNQGLLRIFDIDVSKDQPIKVLKGHQSKVANVSWSPHFGQLLATSSDDCTVRVWNTLTDDVRVL